MRRYVIALAAALVLSVGMAGCGPKVSEAEKTAPPPAGPHGSMGDPTGTKNAPPPGAPSGTPGAGTTTPPPTTGDK